MNGKIEINIGKGIMLIIFHTEKDKNRNKKVNTLNHPNNRHKVLR
jgi:hypothetical protein